MHVLRVFCPQRQIHAYIIGPLPKKRCTHNHFGAWPTIRFHACFNCALHPHAMSCIISLALGQTCAYILILGPGQKCGFMRGSKCFAPKRNCMHTQLGPWPKEGCIHNHFGAWPTIRFHACFKFALHPHAISCIIIFAPGQTCAYIPILGPGQKCGFMSVSKCFATKRNCMHT